MNKICRLIGSVAIFAICVFSATNAGAATISGEVEQDLTWIGRSAVCENAPELKDTNFLMGFLQMYSAHVAQEYNISLEQAATIVGGTNPMQRGAMLQVSQPVDCGEVRGELMKVYKISGITQDMLTKIEQAAEQKRQAEEQKRVAEQQKRQAEEIKRLAEAKELQRQNDLNQQAEQQKRQAEEQKRMEMERQADLKRQEIEKTFSTNNTNSIGMKFVRIPAGSFQRRMKVKNNFGEESVKSWDVTISKPFYLGQYEVTQEQWNSVMGSNPAKYKGRTNPVESVSWNDVQEFIKRLNQKEGHNGYRLPTEAEWEHAAWGGGKNGITHENLAEYAWCGGQSINPVGQKKPNHWGLYDIYGNVFELVQDGDSKKNYGNTATASIDPFVPSGGEGRVYRGGSSHGRTGYIVQYCNAVARLVTPLGFDDRGGRGLGFRLAFSPE